MEQLPLEMVFRILECLPSKTLFALRLLNKTIYSLCKEIYPSKLPFLSKPIQLPITVYLNHQSALFDLRSAVLHWVTDEKNIGRGGVILQMSQADGGKFFYNLRKAGLEFRPESKRTGRTPPQMCGIELWKVKDPDTGKYHKLYDLVKRRKGPGFRNPRSLPQGWEAHMDQITPKSKRNQREKKPKYGSGTQRKSENRDSIETRKGKTTTQKSKRKASSLKESKEKRKEAQKRHKTNLSQLEDGEE